MSPGDFSYLCGVPVKVLWPLDTCVRSILMEPTLCAGQECLTSGLGRKEVWQSQELSQWVPGFPRVLNSIFWSVGSGWNVACWIGMNTASLPALVPAPKGGQEPCSLVGLHAASGPTFHMTGTGQDALWSLQAPACSAPWSKVWDSWGRGGF